MLYDLFRFQPLIVLSEIWQLDIQALELRFRLQYESGGEESLPLLGELVQCLNEWDRRLAYCRELRLTADLRSRPEVSREQKGKAVVKREYYSLLECVRKLQKNYRVYLQEIEICGKNDPALAVLKVFLQNYGEIAAQFNERWKEFPLFYFQKVLQAAYRKPLPDSTWLMLKKGWGEQTWLWIGTQLSLLERMQITPFSVIGAMRIFPLCLWSWNGYILICWNGMRGVSPLPAWVM